MIFYLEQIKLDLYNQIYKISKLKSSKFNYNLSFLNIYFFDTHLY